MAGKPAENASRSGGQANLIGARRDPNECSVKVQEEDDSTAPMNAGRNAAPMFE